MLRNQQKLLQNQVAEIQKDLAKFKDEVNKKSDLILEKLDCLAVHGRPVKKNPWAPGIVIEEVSSSGSDGSGPAPRGDVLDEEPVQPNDHGYARGEGGGHRQSRDPDLAHMQSHGQGRARNKAAVKSAQPRSLLEG